VRTLSLENVSAVRPIREAARRLHAQHPIRHLTVIGSGNASVTGTKLLMLVQVADLGCLGGPIAEYAD
jgi:hypothetical protein